MKKMTRAIAFLAAALSVTMLSGAADADNCRRVFGKLDIQLVPCGESVIGLCAEAAIQGKRSGPIRGTYRFEPREAAPGMGLMTADPNNIALVDDIELVTRRGTLGMEKLGIFNQVTGESVATYTIHSGRYTGILLASGFFDLNTFSGEGIIWGRVCRNK
jgi:hypothetical protein